MISVYFYGVGGHAKVAADVAAALRIRVLGHFDDNPALLREEPVPIRPGVLLQPRRFVRPPDPLVLTIGNNRIRARIADQLESSEFQSLVHPSTQLSPSCIVGQGTVIYHGAIVQADSIIGQHVIINTAANVDHDTTIGDFAHVSPNATLCGNVCVGIGAQIGAAAVVLPGMTVGDWAVVGAGAVVTKPVPAGATVVGNPARIIRNCEDSP